MNTFIIDDQNHPQMVEKCVELRDCHGSCMMSSMFHIQNLFHMMRRKKKKGFICVTIMQNWMLY